jgi:hypothetical protein
LILEVKDADRLVPIFLIGSMRTEFVKKLNQPVARTAPLYRVLTCGPSIA